MNFTQQELTVFGTLAGAFVGGLFGFLTSWISKRSEERKSLTEAVMRVALEEHKTQIDAAQKTGGGWVQPYHVYLISTLQTARLMNAWFLTPKRMKRLLDRQSELVKAAMEHAGNQKQA